MSEELDQSNIPETINTNYTAQLSNEDLLGYISFSFLSLGILGNVFIVLFIRPLIHGKRHQVIQTRAAFKLLED